MFVYLEYIHCIWDKCSPCKSCVDLSQQTDLPAAEGEVQTSQNPPAAAISPGTGPKRLHVSNIPFRFREADLRQLLGVRLSMALPEPPLFVSQSFPFLWRTLRSPPPSPFFSWAAKRWGGGCMAEKKDGVESCLQMKDCRKIFWGVESLLNTNEFMNCYCGYWFELKEL